MIRVSLEHLVLQVVRETVVQVDRLVNLDCQVTQELQVPQVTKELRVRWVQMDNLDSQAKLVRRVLVVQLVHQEPRDWLVVQVRLEPQDVLVTSDLKVQLDLLVL